MGYFVFHWWSSCIKSSKQCIIYECVCVVYIYIYICVCVCVCVCVSVCKGWHRNFLETADILWGGKKHTPNGARTHDISITYRVRLIVAISQIPKAMHPTYISIYQGFQTKKLYMKMTRNTNWKCAMAAILNFTICRKTVSLTAWHTAKMDSAEKIHIEPINEVLFLKNAYRSLFRAIFQFLSWLD